MSTESLASATKHLSSEDFDVVLVDLSLADVGGIKVLETLPLHTPQTPMIVLSATECDPTAAFAIRLGAEDFIGKSECNRKVLVLTIMQSITRHLEKMLA